MLSLIVAATLSQAIPLQALVPTSGTNADALLDGKPDTGWTPDGDAEGEGVLFRFDGEVKVRKVSVTSCAGKQVAITPYVNGTDWPAVKATDKGVTAVDTKTPMVTRSVFLRLDDRGRSACLAEVRFEAEKPLDVRAPRALKATAKASSTLAPADAYHPGYLFDGRLDFGWVEGVKGPGLKESMTLTFDEPVTITAVELWNGYQRSDDHFVKNARAKKVTLAVDGAEPAEFAVADKQGSQKLVLAKPATTKSLTLTIKEAYPGKKYDDLVLSELRVWDADGPRAIATNDLAERADAFKQQLAKSPLKGFADVTLRALCPRPDYTLEAKFRTNHSFVVYSAYDSEENIGVVNEVIDGTWIARGAGAELFGRSHRVEHTNDPYESSGGKVRTTITGGALTITPIADVGKVNYEAVRLRLATGVAAWAVDCDAARDYDALAKAGAFVIEGRALTAILRP